MSIEAQRCDSCAAGTRLDDLVAVRRVYFDDDMQTSVQSELERWCSGCRETYPNEIADASEEQAS